MLISGFKWHLDNTTERAAAHYHLNLSCIHAVAPTFVSLSLVVPPDVGPKLNVVHKEYLNLVFNVIVVSVN